MSKKSRKTYDDVRGAFQTGRILKCSTAELDQLLLAADCEKISEPAEQARASAMRATLRHLLAARQSQQLQRRSSRWAVVATLLAAAALFCFARQAFYNARAGRESTGNFWPDGGSFAATLRAGKTGEDPRTHFTLAELARRAPSIGAGNLQAWWAGEQARQVQGYEEQAKRQALAGDTQGAARSVERADEIRSGIRGLKEPEAEEIIVDTHWRTAGEDRKAASR
ncbi:MAG TPA: hypothetical protein VK474_09085 [Chthoniobacterales bacterium]|nr:hypothetical protein [Chthoniobacterales bacterium]